MNRIVLLSGGIDSAVVLAWSVYSGGNKAEALFVDYGQHSATEERDAALKLVQHFGVPLHVHSMTLPFVSPLTGGNDPGDDRVVVPCRNLILISIAAGLADTWGFDRVAYGATGDGYDDQTKAFVTVAELAVIRSTAGRVGLDAPLLGVNVGEMAVRYNVPLELTWSCYRDGEQCGRCLSCRKRADDFANVQVTRKRLRQSGWTV